MPDIAPLLGADQQEAAEDQETRTWGMILHLSSLLGLITGIGVIAPIVIWMVKRDVMPGIDPHGKAALNWLISCVIYGTVLVVISVILIVATFGIAAFLLIPVWLLLGLAGVACPIFAGMKANNGIVWDYPLTIRFVK